MWGLTTERDALIFSILAPQGSRLTESSRNIAAVSPDGERVAFVATDAGGLSQLYVRSLRSPVTTPVVDSQGASSPFWAPDGSALAFFGRTGLKVVTLSGVRSETLARVTEERGGSWSRTNELLIAPGARDRLYRLPATGGPLQLVIAPDRARGEIGYMWPQFLGDGRRFIYFVLSNDERVRGIYLASLDGGPSRRLIAADASGVVAGDRLLFVREAPLPPNDLTRRQVVWRARSRRFFRTWRRATISAARISATADVLGIHRRIPRT